VVDKVKERYGVSTFAPKVPLSLTGNITPGESLTALAVAGQVASGFDLERAFY
jgi:hypothetical protein